MLLTTRRLFALGMVLLGAQSCVLEELSADRADSAGSAGAAVNAGGSDAGRAGSLSYGGTVAAAGSAAQGGVSGNVSSAGGDGQDGGMAGSSGVGGSAGGSLAGTSSGGGAPSGMPWVRCDPTFSGGAYVDCPTIQPKLGDYCDSDNVYLPDDFCVYCANPAACPVKTAYVTLQCANRAWHMGSAAVSGIGCCPDKLPVHGATCSDTPLCTYGLSGDSCQCFDGKWQCCPDAFEGASCTEPGKQCVVDNGDGTADRCNCQGSGANAAWTCCPVSAPKANVTCYVDAGTCKYGATTCTCAAYGDTWNCK